MIIRTAKNLRPLNFFFKKWRAEVTFFLLEMLLSLEVAFANVTDFACSRKL